MLRNNVCNSHHVYDNALQTIKEALETLIPEFKESEDERTRKELLEVIRHCYEDGGYALCTDDYKKYSAYLEKQEQKPTPDWMPKFLDELRSKKHYFDWDEHRDIEGHILAIIKWIAPDYFHRKEKDQKPIKIDVYEGGKGTTICGQDYKCKKDYKEGNCWYIKDVIYHCSRDGYLNDQNGVSWSCTPEWFNEYIYTNSEWADKEKNDFVSGQFIQCKLSFDDFKEGEHYWLEYVGDDMYVGRSDNILNQKFHITPRQLYTLFSQQLEEVQGPPQEEKQVSLNYEPPFDESPSDKEIIEALIKHLKEQDGFLTAIGCVSTKAILNWLGKQKEQESINEGNMHEPTLDEARKWNEAYEKGYSLGYENGRNEQKPILEVFGFKVGDAVRLKDGDGRKHIIKSFEEVEGVHGPNFYHVEFEDNSASDGIYPGEEYPNGYYTQMEKIEEEQKPVWGEEDMTKLRDVVRMIEDSGHVKSIREHYEKFLNSLPERFNLRSEPPKELFLEKAIKWFEDTFFFENHSSGRGEDYEISTQDFDSMEEMYDSFRKAVIVDSEPIWKPSKGQMRALKSCVSGWLDNTDGNLESLYEDLQKRYGTC